MTVHLLTSVPPGAPVSMSKAPMAYARALRAAGMDHTVETIDSGRGANRGGYVRPLFNLARRVSRRDGDVFHAMEPSVALRGIDSTTFHDFSALRWHGVRNLVTTASTPLALSRSRLVTVHTASTTLEMARELSPRILSRTAVTGHPFPEVSAHRLTTEHDLLWIGTNSPRKNLAGFFRALSSVPTPLRVGILCHSNRAFPTPGLPENLGHQVTFVNGPLSEEDLDRLYRSSTCIVSTSLYEGFHAPVFEAYSRGTQILVPNSAPYAEIYPVGSPGVTFYSANLPGAITRVLERTQSFAPDSRVLAPHSERAVGKRLRELFEFVLDDLRGAFPAPITGSNASWGARS